LTALTAAAGGNVTGSAGDLVQSMAANWAQQKGAAWIGEQVHAEGMDAATAAVLHGIIACAGQAAGGGDCAAGAVGASGTSLLASLLDIGDSESETLSVAERNGRSALLQAVVAGLGALAGSDANLASAIVSAQAEAENNSIVGTQYQAGAYADISLAQLAASNPAFREIWESLGGDDESRLAAFIAYMNKAASEQDYPVA